MPNLSIEQSPPLLSLAGNDVVFKVHTDNQYSKVGQKYYGALNFSPYTQVASSFSIVYGNVNLQFVAVESPDNSGVQFRSIPNAMAVEHWVKDVVLADIKSNYYINRDFEVSYVDGTSLRFLARKIGLSYVIITMPLYQSGNDAVIRPNHRIHLEVITPTGERLGEDSSPTDLDGSVSFNISQYLRKATRKQFSYPENSAQLIVSRPDLTQAFKVRTFESFGTPPIPQRVVAHDQIYFVLQGGISWLQQALINRNAVNWYSQFVNNRSFLGNQPAEKITDHYTSEKLYVIPAWMTALSTEFKLVVKRYLLDESLEEYTFETMAIDGPTWMNLGTTPNSVFEICVSPFTLHNNRVQQGVHDFFVDVFKYEVWVVDEFDDRITEIKSFVFDTQYHEFVRRFFFRNSFGAYETLRCTGKQKGSNEYDIKSGVGVSDLAYTDLDREQIDLSIEENQVFKINTGYLQGKEWESAFRDFLLSKERYIEGDSFLIPIRVTSGKVKQSPDGDDLFDLEFEYQYAFTDEHYSRIGEASKFDKSFTDDFQLNKPSIL